MNSKKFIITCSYQWTFDNKKNTTSEKAIKKIVDSTVKRFNGKKHAPGLDYKIEFKRLRASAGREITDCFLKRIKESNVIIIDITHHNPNVMIELGMAYAVQRDTNNHLSIYLISEDKINLPSNIPGYFVSVYKNERNSIVFKDNGSLFMSIASDVKDHYNSIAIGVVNNEIN
jgi:hypothetical protein